MDEDKQQYVITLICPPTTKIEDSWLQFVINQVTVKKVTWLDKPYAIDLYITQTHKEYKDYIKFLYNLLKTYLQDIQIDIIIQPQAGRKKLLLCADMDSTLIQQETIDELSNELHIKDKIHKLTKQTMEGNVDFTASIIARTKLLKNLPIDKLTAINKQLSLQAGAETLIRTMQANNAQCAIISGGYDLTVSHIAKRLGINYHYSNRLELAENKLTGELLEPILDASQKAQILRKLQTQLNIPNHMTIAVGDGANDLQMLEAAGLGVSFQGKEILQQRILAQIKYTNLTSLLFCQGYSRDQFIEVKANQ